MPKSTTTVWALNDVTGQQELRPISPSAMLPPSPQLKMFLINLNRIYILLISQIRGVTETPEVVFDLTQGDEGVETIPPHDTLKAYLSPPVEVRHHSFRRDWQTNKCSNNVLNIITGGLFYHSSQNQN